MSAPAGCPAPACSVPSRGCGPGHRAAAGIVPPAAANPAQRSTQGRGRDRARGAGGLRAPPVEGDPAARGAAPRAGYPLQSTWGAPSAAAPHPRSQGSEENTILPEV